VQYALRAGHFEVQINIRTIYNLRERVMFSPALKKTFFSISQAEPSHRGGSALGCAPIKEGQGLSSLGICLDKGVQLTLQEKSAELIAILK